MMCGWWKQLPEGSSFAAACRLCHDRAPTPGLNWIANGWLHGTGWRQG
jgi:hypothetical protein